MASSSKASKASSSSSTVGSTKKIKTSATDRDEQFLSEIFDSAKQKKSSNNITVSKDSKSNTTNSSNNNVTDSTDALFCDTRGLSSAKRRTTAEGYPIYTAEELGINPSGSNADPNAGNTDDCPFDCQCCF